MLLRRQEAPKETVKDLPCGDGVAPSLCKSFFASSRHAFFQLVPDFDAEFGDLCDKLILALIGQCMLTLRILGCLSGCQHRQGKRHGQESPEISELSSRFALLKGGD